MLIAKLAWRNIWRNRRRTAITLASISFGLSALLFLQSLVKSLQDQIVEKATRTYSSHLQVQAQGVSDPKVPDLRIEDPTPVMQALQNLPEAEAYARRIVFTGLVSSALTSKGSLVIGIDPESEKKLTIVRSYIREGRYLEAGQDREIMLGSKLARELDVRLGEKMVVMVQATDGSLSAEAFRIAGIYTTDSPVYDGQIVYVPITAAQRLLVCGEGVSMVSARLKDVRDLELAQKKLSAALAGKKVEVLTWKEAAHEIVSIQEFQNAILLIVLIVIFSIVALGIFNTLLMSLFERIREFGIMMALGAKPRFIAALVVTEAALLGALGIGLGGAVGGSLIFFFRQKGVPLPISDAMGYWMPFDKIIFLKYAWSEITFACGAALVTSIAAAIVPALRAAKIQVVDALRHY